MVRRKSLFKSELNDKIENDRIKDFHPESRPLRRLTFKKMSFSTLNFLAKSYLVGKGGNTFLNTYLHDGRCPEIMFKHNKDICVGIHRTFNTKDSLQ